MQLRAIRRLVGDWDAEFMWVLQTSKGSSLDKVLLKMASNGAIYFLRKERNAIVYNGRVPCAEKVFICILFGIRLKVAGLLKEKGAALARADKDVCTSWGIWITDIA